MDGRSWPGPLTELLRDSIDDDAVESLREAVAARRRDSRRGGAHRRPALIAAAALAGAAALLLLVVVISGAPEPEPLRRRGGAPLTRVEVSAEAAAPRRVELDDGSTLDLAPGTTLVAEHNDAEAIELRCDRGRVTFEVEPGGGRRWRVDAGLAVVEVVGTVFTVTRTADRLAVTVARGQVRVSSDRLEDSPRLLAMGDSLELLSPDAVVEERVASASESEALPDRTPEAAERDAGPAVARSWRAAAGEGDWSAAYQALGAEELQRRTGAADTMAELLVLADVARLSGHPAEAVAPLERAAFQLEADRRSAVAAFTLGRLQSDQLGRPGAAARAFRRCLALGPPAALREDAMARLAEAHARAGQYDAARAAAQQYLRRYPQGSRAASLRRWVTPR